MLNLRRCSATHGTNGRGHVQNALAPFISACIVIIIIEFWTLYCRWKWNGLWVCLPIFSGIFVTVIYCICSVWYVLVVISQAIRHTGNVSSVFTEFIVLLILKGSLPILQIIEPQGYSGLNIWDGGRIHQILGRGTPLCDGPARFQPPVACNIAEHVLPCKVKMCLPMAQAANKINP